MRRDGSGPVSCKEAQQLYGLGTEPAANLKPNNNQPAAPRMLELGVGLMPFAPGRCGDDLNAPFVRDRHIEVHVRKPDVAGDPGAGLATDSRDGMLKGQHARGEDTRGSAG